MTKFITRALIMLVLLAPASASAQTATSTPPSETICINANNPPCTSQTMAPSEVATYYAQQSVTPTPTPMPTGLAAGANAGTGAPAPSLLNGAQSSASSGVIDFGTGTAATAGAMVTGSWPVAYVIAPKVILQTRNGATAKCALYATWDATSFTVGCGLAPTSSQPVGTYEFEYIVEAR